MAIHSSTLTWKIPWTKEPDRLQSMGSQRVGHDWATSLSCFFRISLRGFLVAQRLKLLPASARNARDLGSIAGSGRSPGEENGNPLQYSCLEESNGQRSLVGCSPRSHKESDTTEWLHFTVIPAILGFNFAILPLRLSAPKDIYN